MRRLVTAQEMKEIDRRTIEETAVPSLVLMENAGLGVVRVVEELMNKTGGTRVIVFCGKGNNGGDGMVAARHLFNRKYDVCVNLVGEKRAIQGDAWIHLQMLEKFGVPVSEISEARDLRHIRSGDLIIDALLGTGVTGEIGGLLKEVIEWINRSALPVVSVDLPSGLNSDDGSFVSVCVRANRTATMAEIKRGLVLPPGRELAGQVTLVDIGSPECIAQSTGVRTYLLEKEDIQGRLPERPADAHKGTFGKVAILAGSTGMTGAAVLSSLASLRAGAGLTILGIPENLNSIVEEKMTEVITRPLAQTPQGTLALSAEKEIDLLLTWADVVAVGPGLSIHPETSEIIRRIILRTKKPVVIDADGINAFAGKIDLLEKKKGIRILTPHPGELSRLTGLSIRVISRNRIDVARETAERLKCVVVLKGAPTVVAASNGEVFVNPTGNSGMATAGAGDVLTGTIAGLLAQNCSPLDAAICGVYIHGFAGDLARDQLGGRSLIAGDLIEFLCKAFQEVEI